MTGWVILVDQARDFPNADTPHKVITTRDYLARPKLFAGLGRAKVINLSRSYNYQSKGYYASLLAEARGHRVIPTVETMLDLRELKLYEQSLPELHEALTAAAFKAQATESTTFDLLFCFGFAQDPRFDAFGRLLFDCYRCPAIEVTITAGKRWRIDRLRARPLAKLGPDEAEFFRKSLHRHTQRDWRNPRGRPIARYSLAVLHDPQEALPPPRPTRSSTSRGSPKSSRSRSSSSPASSSPSLPSLTASSSARRPRSTATPIVSPSAPGPKACRSSTIRSR